MYSCQRCGIEVAVTFFHFKVSDQEVCELCFETLQEQLQSMKGRGVVIKLVMGSSKPK